MMNSLQELVDLLVIKVTQLDSTGGRSFSHCKTSTCGKHSRASTIQNQQVSRNSIPNPVMEMYQRQGLSPHHSTSSPRIEMTKKRRH
uniref:Uncharacterized protein n=1 Tax=Sphaerodactylus townsendi TaxID=933632 RepID=A0ACB8FW49_9SAUR